LHELNIDKDISLSGSLSSHVLSDPSLNNGCFLSASLLDTLRVVLVVGESEVEVMRGLLNIDNVDL